MWVKLNDWHELRDERDYFEGATTRCGKPAEGAQPVNDLPADAKKCSQCSKIIERDEE